METLHLAVATRSEMGKKVASLRAASKIPAVVYGHGTDNRFVSVASVPFQKLFAKAGENTLVDLSVDEKPAVKVLIHDVQRDPVTNEVQHVDFYEVKMTEKLSTHIPISFDGDSRAVKELGGILIKSADEVLVECLPNDLVHELHVDLSKLKEFNDALTVADIELPAGIALKQDLADVIATVKAPKTEAELEADLAQPAVADVAQVEVEKKGKEEADEAAAKA